MPTQLLRGLTVGALILGFGCGEHATAPPLTPSPLLRTESGPVPTLERFYGPEQFTRTRGAPDEFTRDISTSRFEAPFVLHVRSGAPDGSGRSRAAVVTLDANVLLSEGDFARQTEWAIPVTPGETAVLGVTLRGAPDAFIEVWLEGKRSDPVFCPDGPSGTYPTLPEAIAAAPIGGTVLVCDGEHALDLVRIRKPITLRSQNPGGATIADADPSLVPQGGRPALVIDSVPAGLVRLVDLNFLVRGRGVYAGGHFDQVVLDSVRFIGRSLNVPHGVWIDRSSVESARVEVTRSRFESMAIGVFPVAAVETNVSWSTFDNFSGGAVTYSGRPTTPVPSVSFGRVEHNTFTNCGLQGCIRVVGPPQPSREVVIAHNVMTRATGPTQAAAIVVSRIAASPAAARAPVIVEHNQVSGAVLGTGPSWQSTSWSVAIFLSNLGGPGGTPVVLRNNRVKDVHTAISASATVTAHDNFFISGARAITQQNPSAIVDFQRNDVTFETSIFRTSAGGHQGNYRCNWWGSASGPPFPNENVAAGSYTPWSTQPIAGTLVSCDGTGTTIPPPSVVRVCSVALAGGPPTFPTVSAAYDAVTMEGTILICDGTHVVRDVRIDKAITIRGEGPGKPMLDAQGARNNFHIRDVAGGGVVLRSLRFQGTWLITESPASGYGNNVNIEGSYSTILIEDSEFFPSGQLVAYDVPGPGQSRLTYNSAIWFWSASGGGITIRNNVFAGGDVGVGGQGADATIVGNDFRGQSNAAVHVGEGTTVIAENDVRQCGTAWCIAAFGATDISVVGNRILVEIDRQTTRAILMDAANAEISGNSITGVGGSRLSSDPGTFPIREAAIAVHASNRSSPNSGADVFGNTIGGAYSGLSVGVNLPSSGALVIEARDNVIAGVVTTLSSVGASSQVNLRMTRNDFSGYATVYQGGTLGNGDLRCNWWGSSAGPANPGGQLAASVYTPWATQPIAGRADISCP